MKPIATLAGQSLGMLARLTMGTPVNTPPPPPVNKPNGMNFPRLSEFRTHGEPTLENALRRARAFVGNIRANAHAGQYALSFLGRSGNGKTMLAKAILMELGISAWWTLDLPRWNVCGAVKSADAAFRDCRKLAKGLQERRFGLDFLAEPFLVVLDDFGAWHDPSGYVASEFDTLLRARADKWTLLTSNKPLAEIAETESRSASWLIRDANVCVEITAPDYALRPKQRGAA